MKKLRLFDSLKFVLATVACMFAIVPVHAATLPAGYTELEYLESTGTQYIDTRIPSNSNMQTEVSFSPTGWEGAVFGNYSDDNLVQNSNTLYISPQALGYLYTTDYGAVLDGNHNRTKIGDISLDTVYNVTIDWKNRRGIFDNTVIPFVSQEVWQGTTNQVLFARTTGTAGTVGYYGKLKLYYAKLWDNGTLVRDFVPVRRDSDGVLGMYDLANSNPETAFYTNAGTGEFIAGEWQIKIATTKYNEESFAPVKTDLSAAVNAVEYVVSNTMTQAQQIDQIANEKQTRPDEGCPAKYCLLVEDEDGTPHWYPIAGANGVAHNLPAGYTELQYIESTGTQYIDTGYIPNSNTRWELDNEYTETPPSKYFYNGLYQVATGFQAARFDIALGVSGMVLDYGAINIVNSNTSSFINTRYTYVVDAKNNKWAYNDTTGSFPSYSNMTEITKSLYLFARNDISGVDRFAKQRTYSSKIYDDGILVRDFVPAKRNSDNEIGMYDLADPNPATAFHTNAGTGEFVAGPDM